MEEEEEGKGGHHFAPLDGGFCRYDARSQL